MENGTQIVGFGRFFPFSFIIFYVTFSTATAYNLLHNLITSKSYIERQGDGGENMGVW